MTILPTFVALALLLGFIGAIDPEFYRDDRECTTKADFINNITEFKSWIEDFPTKRYSAANFTNFDYSIQHPYNLAESDRYSVSSSGVYDFTVYSTDQPFQQGSDTNPRTEMRIKNDYKSGKHTFQGDMYIPTGTTETNVLQVSQ